MVQCIKTGVWYNPQTEWEKLMADPEVIAIFVRMQNEQGIGWPARQQ